MEGGRDEVDGRVAQMIQAARFAGGYRILMREVPKTAAGFAPLAERHSARAATLAGEIATAGCVNTPSLAMPDRLER